MAALLYPQSARVLGVAGQSGADYLAAKITEDGCGPNISMRPQSVQPALHKPFNDIMPDPDWDYLDSCPPPESRAKADNIRRKLKYGTGFEENRNREFRSEGNNGLTVVYQITKFKWSRASADKVRDRVYALIADRTRVARQHVIDETETMFNYEMIVEIEFKKASIIKQFEELVRKTGASVEEVK